MRLAVMQWEGRRALREGFACDAGRAHACVHVCNVGGWERGEAGIATSQGHTHTRPAWRAVT